MIWTLVRALHLVAMAFFVGGQLMLGAVLVPVERHAPDRERLGAIARRFGAGSLVALVFLAATGAAMAGHYGDWGAGVLHAKLALVGSAVALVLLHMRRPGWHVLEAGILLLSLAIVWLGIELAH